MAWGRIPLSYNLQVLKEWAEQSGLKFNGLPMARNLTPHDGRGSCCVFDTCGDAEKYVRPARDIRRTTRSGN